MFERIRVTGCIAKYLKCRPMLENRRDRGNVFNEIPPGQCENWSSTSGGKEQSKRGGLERAACESLAVSRPREEYITMDRATIGQWKRRFATWWRHTRPFLLATRYPR